MIFYNSLIYITFVLMLASVAFGGSGNSNVQIEDCGNPDEDLLEIEDIKILPENIAPGREFTIEATGNLSEEVTQGSFVIVTAKVGSVTVLKKSLGLCETIAKKEDNEIRCPIPAGPIQVSQKFRLPENTNPADYTIKLEAYMENEDSIGCIIGKADLRSVD